jgi:hypothetical protein
METLTYGTFLKQVQQYYGPYPSDEKGRSTVFEWVMAYLRRDIDLEKLPKLIRYLTYSHPVNYGPPDIAAIERAIKWARENDKGSDVHRSMADIETADFRNRLDPLTEEEREQGEQMLNNAGGLPGMLEGIVHHVDPEDDVERRDPYSD